MPRDAEARTHHVLIIVNNRVTSDARVLKEARSLSHAGYRVTVLGIRETTADQVLELRDYCTIRRVTTTDKLPEPKPTNRRTPAAAKSPYAGPLGELRHWAGRIRENRRYLEAALPLKPDVVVSCDVTALPAGYWLKRRLGCRLVYDVHELFADMTGEEGPVFRFLYTRTESFLIRRADAVITVSEPRAEELARRYRISMPQVVMSTPTSAVDSPSAVHEPVRLLYQGAYIEGRGLEEIVSLAERIRGRAHLYLQGFGPIEPILRGIVSERALGDVVSFLNPCPPDSVVEAARDHDIGLVVYKPTSLNNRLASPNKLFDYMAAGLVVVGSDVPVVRAVLEETGCGVVFDPADIGSAYDKIEGLLGDRQALGSRKQAALNGVDKYLWRGQENVLLAAVRGGAAP